ncbi:MAG: GNAT family N-acetyltransferase [Brachymonas sp.]|nr:GNAT family N-acetyltransferase [Brachymonas sp.]
MRPHLQKRSGHDAAALLQPLNAQSEQRVLAAMQRIQTEMGNEVQAHQPALITLRSPEPGDIGWVIREHGRVYAREYGWNWEFEALVAGICADFVKHYQPEWERCWIAQMGQELVGSAFVARKNKTTAQLRMLILSPQARGLGLGARLTDECLSFARAKGYQKMVLWTNSVLTQAREIYARRGFVLTKSEPYVGFGHQLVSETWELVL